MIKNLRNHILMYKDEIISNIKRLVEIKSVYDEKTISKNAPFGKGIRDVFDEFIKIANEKGFEVRDFNGYALDIILKSNNLEKEYSLDDNLDGNKKNLNEDRESLNENYIAILNHLDTVGIKENENWNTNPFKLEITDEFLFARGVNDNKGPCIISLYVLYFLKKFNIKLNKDVRLIIGGAEETSWKCMDYYFKMNKNPIFGFSPDGDFPIVNGEKGVLKYKINIYNDKTFINKFIPKTYENYILYDLELIFDKDFFNYIKFILINYEYIKKINDAPQYITKSFINYEQNNILEKKYIGNFNFKNINIEKNTIFYKVKPNLSRNPDRGENCLDLFIDDMKKIFDINLFEIFCKHYNLNIQKLEKIYSNTKKLVDLLYNNFYRSYYGEKLNLNYKDDKMGNTTTAITAIYNSKCDVFINLDIRFVKSVSKKEIENILNNKANVCLNLENLYYKKMIYVDENSKYIKDLQKAYEKVTNEKAELFTKGGISYARSLECGVAFGTTFNYDIANSHFENENLRIDTIFKCIEIYIYAIKNLCS